MNDLCMYDMTYACMTWCQDRGFNTGVMLLDLSRLRLLDWVHMWRLVASRELASLQFTVLADQVNLSPQHFL